MTKPVIGFEDERMIQRTIGLVNFNGVQYEIDWRYHEENNQIVNGGGTFACSGNSGPSICVKPRPGPGSRLKPWMTNYVKSYPVLLPFARLLMRIYAASSPADQWATPHGQSTLNQTHYPYSRSLTGTCAD